MQSLTKYKLERLRLPKVNYILELFGIESRTRYPQHYLLNALSADRIVEFIVQSNRRINFSETFIMELGSGPGLFTRSILGFRPGYLVSVESDKRFLPMIHNLVDIAPCPMVAMNADIHAVNLNDLLNHSFTSSPSVLSTSKPITSTTPTAYLFDRIEIIANLAVGKATPYLFKCLTEAENQLPLGLTMMVQRIPAERMAAPPFTVYRNALSVLVQSMCKPQFICDVPKPYFYPKAKSSIKAVRFEFLPNRYRHLSHLEAVLSIGFKGRRKSVEATLSNRFSLTKTNAWLKEAKIPLDARAPELTTQNWIDLAEVIRKSYKLLDCIPNYTQLYYTEDDDIKEMEDVDED